MQITNHKISKKIIIFGALGYLFLYIPIIILILFSFNNSRINVHWVGFTLKWYHILFADIHLISAAINSFIIAIIASIISTVLGTMAGVALHKYKVPVLSLLIMVPIAAPEILVGVALLLFYLLIHFTLGLTSIMLAHIAFCLSFVAISVKTRLHGIDDNILYAARDLGATPLKTFYLILLPMIFPGIVAGALMAFTLSIDDFIITFFTAGIGSSTLPLAIYSMIKMGVTPEINAASTIIIGITLLLTVIVNKLSPQLLKTT